MLKKKESWPFLFFLMSSTPPSAAIPPGSGPSGPGVWAARLRGQRGATLSRVDTQAAPMLLSDSRLVRQVLKRGEAGGYHFLTVKHPFLTRTTSRDLTYDAGKGRAARRSELEAWSPPLRLVCALRGTSRGPWNSAEPVPRERWNLRYALGMQSAV